MGSFNCGASLGKVDEDEIDINQFDENFLSSIELEAQGMSSEIRQYIEMETPHSAVGLVRAGNSSAGTDIVTSTGFAIGEYVVLSCAHGVISETSGKQMAQINFYPPCEDKTAMLAENNRYRVIKCLTRNYISEDRQPNQTQDYAILFLERKLPPIKNYFTIQMTNPNEGSVNIVKPGVFVKIIGYKFEGIQPRLQIATNKSLIKTMNGQKQLDPHFIYYKSYSCFGMSGSPVLVSSVQGKLMAVAIHLGFDKLRFKEGKMGLYFSKAIFQHIEQCKAADEAERTLVIPIKITTQKRRAECLKYIEEIGLDELSQQLSTKMIEEHTELKLSQKRLANMKVLTFFKEAKTVNLDNNNLSKIEYLDDFPALENLSLNHNELTNIEELGSHVNHLSLIHLYLNHNKIQQLPPLMIYLSRLRTLQLKNNQLRDRSFTSSFAKLTSLEILEISKNKLTKLPQGIYVLTSLKYLDLAGNQITQITKEIRTLENLVSLILSDNRINFVTQKIGQLQQLKYLSLNNNKLTQFPIGIVSLQLTKLFLDKNYFTNMPLQLKKIKSIDELTLPKSKIAWSTCPQIKYYLETERKMTIK